MELEIKGPKKYLVKLGKHLAKEHPKTKGHISLEGPTHKKKGAHHKLKGF